MDLKIIDELKEHTVVPCVSIILPVHRTWPSRKMDPLELKKVIDNAKDLIRSRYDGVGNEVIEQLEDLQDNIDYFHTEEGIGLFVSPGFSKVVTFPFPVKERIIVGENFEIRDLVFMEEQMSKYLLLSLTGNAARLYEGMGSELKEIKDANFPIPFEDDYEYNPPSKANSYGPALKSPEDDKSKMEEKRMVAHLNKVDHLLGQYLDKDIPFLAAGVKKELGYFKKHAKNAAKLNGMVEGNYENAAAKTLGELAAMQVKEWLIEQKEDLLDKLREAVGKRSAASGIEEVWNLAEAGMGMILFVERDFSVPGFISDANFKFSVQPPREKHTILADAVDHVIATVLDKRGRVVMVENGSLEEHDGIAMLLRYPKGDQTGIL